jgi:7,8-dihydropterin-6-yl-methyl-4-(beta-D-ribofuranosyl)aminobenzene 5'-phosphate synthase
MEKVILNAVDKAEILTLQDNYIDLTIRDNNEVVTRAMPMKEGRFRKSILSEHGFSSIVKTTTGSRTRTMRYHPFPSQGRRGGCR